MSRRTTNVIVISLSALFVFALPGVQAAKNPETDLKFTVPTECRIVTNDKKPATLEDLKVGMKVHVRFQNKDGVMDAEAIVEAKPPTGEPKPAPKPGQPPKPSTDLHANGVIESIDLASKTVTIHGRIPPPKPQS